MQVNKTVASSLLIVCCLSGELMILKINGRNRSIDLVHLIPLNKEQVENPASSKATPPKNQKQKINLYGLSKLGDGRFVVMSNKGFTIWQVQGLTTSGISTLKFDNNMIQLQQQSKNPFLPDEVVSQVIEVTSNIVVCSTMSCTYYKVNLKNGNIEAQL